VDCNALELYRVIQEECSLLWEVIVLVIVRKTCIPNMMVEVRYADVERAAGS